ncbi:hypothetical protein DH2020_005199 [Rehmannia glutinosa]|uniref:GATA-type domain-containing protein n=1 Tax=Rehmannia glutinosa TaxID=99300 RepID=A0ABR0XRW3_REHGL
MGILDPKDACFGVDDDLFDFTFEGEAEEDKDPKTILKPADVSSSSPTNATPFSHETQTGSFPEFVEEELEWLSNKDAFPPIETCFGILSDSPQLLLNHHSPVSVLDNVSSTNSNSNDNGSTIAKVPTNFPVRARSTNRRRRGRVNFGGSLSQQILGLNQVNVENKRGSAKRSRGARSGKRCLHCQTDKTPQWREGPMGPNAM